MVANMEKNITDTPFLEIPSIDLHMSQREKQNQQNEQQQLQPLEQQENPELENSDEQRDYGNESNNDNNRRDRAGQQNTVTNETRPPGDVNQYKGPKIWRAFVKNWPIISQPLALLMVFIVIWAAAYSVYPEYVAADSTLMRIVYLFIGAQISGFLVTIIYLPDMLGMLFWGVLYTNIGYGKFPGYERFEAFLRDMALVNILLLAGFGLDVKAFKILYATVVRLSIVPSIAEVAVIAVLSYFLLQMPWTWGVLLGLVITAVSPNVVVTIMLKLKERRLGLNSGIHTLIYAMTACNDVLAIFLFGTFLTMIYTQGGDLKQQLIQGPVGIGIGIVFGCLYGLLILYLPSKKSRYANGLRFVMTLLGGTVSIIGSNAIDYPSGGALGCVMIPFVAKSTPHLSKENAQVVRRLDLVWKFLKPISFSLIGKEVDFSVLDAKVVGYGIAIIFVSSLFRLLAGYLSTWRSSYFTWKERAFITLSGFPKATVQATLGAVAMDMARSLKSVETYQLANNVLIISVLAIICTAPLGALLMIRLAPILLRRSTMDVGPLGATSSISSMDLEENNPEGRQALEGRYRRNEI